MRVIKATSDMIYVQDIDDAPKETASGIILSASSKPPQRVGIIVSFGKDVEEVNVGDMAVFHERGGQAVVIDGVIGRMLKYNELYGVMASTEPVEGDNE